MIYSEANIQQLVKMLKEYHDKWYELNIEQLSDFLKIKSNLLKEGILITDEMLELPEEQLVKILKNQLKLDASKNTLEEDKDILEKLTSVDVDTFDQDRLRVRKSLFGTSVSLVLSKSGKAFAVSFSNNMQTVKVNVPVTWDIKLPQSLLLSLYDKEFKDTLPHIDPDDIQSVIGVLSKRYNDYAILKELVKLDYLVGRQNEHYIEDQLGYKLAELGLTGTALTLVYTLINLYKLRRIDRKLLFDIIGKRRRIAIIIACFI